MLVGALLSQESLLRGLVAMPKKTRMMVASPPAWESEAPVDSHFSDFFKDLGESLTDPSCNDDALIMFVGPTGSGKSGLMLYALDAYRGGVDLDNVVWDHPEWYERLDIITEAYVEGKDPRPALAWDESQMRSRRHSSNQHETLLELMAIIRGMNVLHLWCYPEAEYIDKQLIKSRINGIFAVADKGTKYRKTVFWPKDELRRLLNDEKNILAHTLTSRKIYKHYEVVVGWFKNVADYLPDVWEGYESKKTERMRDAIREARQKFTAEKAMTLTAAANALGINRERVSHYLKTGIEEKAFLEGKDYVMNALGIPRLTDNGLDQMTLYLANKKGVE